MNNSSDSSFSFRKRRLQFRLPVQPHRKLRKKTVKEAVLHIKTLSLPLISTSTGQLCEALSLEPYKPYTIGRKFGLCDFTFTDRRVSKIHCQLYFDSLENKIYFSDGLFPVIKGCTDFVTKDGAKISTNGVFVNGSRISGFVELRVGDLILLVCGKEKACSSAVSIGFLVEKAVIREEIDYASSFKLSPHNVHTEQSYITLKPCRVVDNMSLLLSWCRDILCSDDPVSYIQKFVISNQENRIGPFLYMNNDSKLNSNSVLQSGCPNRKRVYSMEIEAVEKIPNRSQEEVIVVSKVNKEIECSNFSSVANTNSASQKSRGAIDVENVVANSSTGGELFNDENYGTCLQPPGKKFYLNRLQFHSQDSEEIGGVVSLPELFNPLECLKRVFIATFTSDISWFLTYCKIPSHLPVTIACHSAERCWSSDPEKRTSVPFSEFPNLTVVYPPFPEVIAFNNDRKNSGIACHHPKLIVLQREDRLRVVVTSANLVEKQWLHVTNTVWWQDFPQLSSSNCLSLFTQLSTGENNIGPKCDFGAQLAGFMASLIADVPSQAHWILELTKYDYEGASGHLVSSVPGIHLHKSPSVYKSNYHLVGNKHKLWSCGAKFLSSVEASIVGSSHIYRMSADSNGEHLKKLALFLRKCHQNMDGMSEIVLRRETNIPADRNAVSVFIPNPEEYSAGEFAQLGFLPRNIAKWVAPLSDIGLFSFAAYIYPKEVLETAVEGSNKKVKLILYVYAGPSLSTFSEVTQLEYASAICSLVASCQRYVGLWRMKEILDLYKWPEHLQSEFLFGSSSVGCVNAQFLAAFAAAAGKTSMPFSDSEESDPEWGCWTASQELKNPSIRIIFPSIERIKTNRSGIMASRRMLCFSEKTWQRLENVGIVHDAIPHPPGRIGFPMHVKVGRRRFQSKNESPFGWVYCGSHNFSAAAWGRPISERQSNGNTRNNSALGSRLHISNYELGIIFIVPPPPSDAVPETQNLDDIAMPFVVPPPKYRASDKPATAKAMREALKEEGELAGVDVELTEEEEEEEQVMEAIQCNLVEEKDDEKAYAHKLWTQLDSDE